MTTHKRVRGVIHTKDSMRIANLVVRFTHDFRGKESLSISDDKEIMMQIDFTDVEQIIKKARGNKYGK